jgi:DNA-directed RNA polymerase subunit RPC12/RpoP
MKWSKSTMVKQSQFGAERRCQANEHCAATSRSLDLPVVVLGKPDQSITFHCNLCRIYVCGNCSKRILMTIQLGNQTMKLWQICCPRCGLPLDDETSERHALYSNHSGIVGFLNYKGGVWSIADSDARINLQSTIDKVRDYHHQRALTLLYTFNTEISINGSIMLVDKAIAESPEESLSWFFKALLCHRAGYHIAGRNAWDMLFASDGITRSLSLVEVFNLREKQYDKCSESLRSYEAHIEASERDCSMQKRRVFNPDLAEFDQRVQAYQQGRTSTGNFVRDLFKGALQVPKSVQMFLEALGYEETLNFSAVEAERSKLIELLVEKLDRDKTMALMSRAIQMRLGSVSQTDFYNDLQKLADEAGIDITPLRALSTYLHYNTLTDSIDSLVFLGEVWNTTQRESHARAKSSEEYRLIETTARLHLLRRLLDYLSGKTSVVRISGTYASNPGAAHRLAEGIASEMAKPKVPFWKKLFGRSR